VPSTASIITKPLSLLLEEEEDDNDEDEDDDEEKDLFRLTIPHSSPIITGEILLDLIVFNTAVSATISIFLEMSPPAPRLILLAPSRVHNKSLISLYTFLDDSIKISNIIKIRLS
jgi:hypothetical protein